jgi:GNAT superfamily N-acetyltransferase
MNQHDILLDAIETGLFILPEIPGRLTALTIPGIRGRITPTSNLFANLVGAYGLTSATAEDSIRRTHELFRSQEKEYGWIVGPDPSPPDLTDRLRRDGMTLEKELEMAGMVKTDLEIPIPANPSVEIRPITRADLDLASRVLAPALNIPDDAARIINDAELRSQEAGLGHVYLAYLEGVPEPVAFASSVYLAKSSIVVLFCAATLEAYRGRGIYTSLIARRLTDAGRDGMRAAVVQAVRTSSAPICRKLGFQEIAGLDWYAWHPGRFTTASPDSAQG